MQDFKNLKVWEKAHSFVFKIYKITNEFPKEDQYNLVSQIRRAAVSIPTNIAEGCGKNSSIELARYCQISMGSTTELEYLLLLSNELNYISDDKYKNLYNELVEIKKMLSSLLQKIRKEN